jgi:hypothetical protein
MTQTPSPGNGATPGTGSSATDTTTASGGATPSGKQLALTLDEAIAKIAELERHAQNKTEEALRHGTKLTATEKELAAYKAAEQAAKEAQMTETELLKKQAADLQAQQEALAAELYEARVHQEVARLAPKFNFTILPSTLAKLLLVDDDTIEFEDGKPTNVEKLLEKLAKQEPDLVRKEQQQQQGAPQLPAMNPGRSNIQSPGAGAPGRRVSLDDPGIFKPPRF